MFHKKSSCPSLALFVSIVLSGGAFFIPSSYVSAADVTIDSSHPPQRNVPNPDDPATPNSAASVGTDSEDASGNTLTVDRYQEGTLSVFGGVVRGTGNADGNTVRIKGATTEIASIYGGAAWGTGHAKGNKVYFDAGTMSFPEWLVGGYVGRSGKAEENTVEVNGGKTESLYGGFSNSKNAAGQIQKNHVVIRGGTIAGKVYGGVYGGAHATGDVTHNTVTITGGTLKKAVCGGSLEKADSTGNVAHNEVTVAGGVFSGDVYGGYTRRGGALTGNIVTITGGELNNVYAAYSAGNVSEIKGNVVNLGDGKNEMKAGYRIAKYIFGASGGNRASYAGNTLNVKASARAKNIVNFDKVNFYFTDTLQPHLTLRDSMGTKFKSLKDITVYGSPRNKTGTLIENNTSGGIVVRDGFNSVTKTGDTAEVTLEKDATGRKVLYSRLIFKGAATAESDGTDTWGGRSVIGNTTTDNVITVQAGTHTNIYGGWTTGTGSEASDKDASKKNSVTVSGTATVTGTVYGGFTDAAGGKATENTVTVEKAIGSSVVGGQAADDAVGNKVKVMANVGAVAGGKSTGAAASSNTVEVGSDDRSIAAGAVTGGTGATSASGNTIKLTRTTVTGDVVGGNGATSANSNTLHLDRTTVAGDIIGGRGGAASGNTVAIDHTTATGVITGGTTNGTGNTLNVKGTNTAKNIAGFQKLKFEADTAAAGKAMLTLSNGETTLADKDLIEVSGSAAHGKVTLMKNENGINIAGHADGVLRSETTDTTEQNIDVVKTGAKITSITYEGWQFAGVTTPVVSGTDAYGGISKAGNTTTGNKITLTTGAYTNVYGGWTTGKGSKSAAEKRGNSTKNIVTVKENAVVNGTIYGGYTDAADGKATDNEVVIDNAQAGNIVGGEGRAADGNVLRLRNAAVEGSIIGGNGATANGNTIHLENTLVKGAVTGGAAGGTDNTLAVYYGTKTSEIGDFNGIQNLRFYMENAPTDGSAHTLLKLTNVSGGDKTLSHMNLHLYRSGDAKKLRPGDSFTLMENMRGGIAFGDGVAVTAQDGIAYNYTLQVAPDQKHPNLLKATVHQAGLAAEAKSPVETRAGLANFINQGADYLVESGIVAAEMSVSVGMSGANANDAVKSSKSDIAADSTKSGDAEKRAQRQTANANAVSYQLWAGAGANNMRVESGSYVDSKGWSLGIGWAREYVIQGASKLLFSPFVEYGRGTYDSYLDDGTHGSGKISYLGGGVLGKLTQEDGLWLEASARGGSASSDYQLHGANAGYDGSNTYYGIHIGVGKTVAWKKDASIDVYARCFWSHQNGMTVKLSSGNVYDFADVNSYRLRLGFRYSQKKPSGELYTGLAWEHEFDGEAGAYIGGDAAPSPSLKGSSYMLELGYRLLPKSSRISYDFHIHGWQGKRRGLSGGASVQWAF